MICNYVLARKCDKPPDGTNTVPVPAEVSLVYGEEYVYSCLSGYEPYNANQPMVTSCTANGNFSLEPAPFCKGKLNYLGLIFYYPRHVCQVHKIDIPATHKQQWSNNF